MFELRYGHSLVLLLSAALVLSCSAAHSFAAGDGYEPDNSRAAARNITLNEKQNHTLDPAGDEDWIRFAPPFVPGSYSLKVTNSGTKTIHVEFWLSQGLLPELPLVTGTLRPGQSSGVTYNAAKGAKCVKIGVWPNIRRDTGAFTVVVTRTK